MSPDPAPTPPDPACCAGSPESRSSARRPQGDRVSTPAHHPTHTGNGAHNASQAALNAPVNASAIARSDRSTPVNAARLPAGQAARIDGAELLDRVHAALLRYVVLPSPDAAVAAVLWIAATHAQPAWAHAPRLVIRAPEKRCGKSRLLDLVEALCWNPFITVNSSPAAVYRSITADPPTLLVDEADTIFGPKADGNEDLRGLLNAGHQRNRPAKRYDASSNRVESIPTFAMAALAGIGAMPDTIEDRAVIIRMRRRAPGETVRPYRHKRDRPALNKLANQLNTWLRADLPILEKAEPAMPVEDRAADTWEPLIAVADHAGNIWPQRAREAVLALIAQADENSDTSDRIRLLIDCHAAIGDESAIPTTVLLQRLKADPEAPWMDYGNHGLTPRRLGILLSEYDIRSATIRFDGIGQAKGYHRAAFHDAWRRYCPGITADATTAVAEPAGGGVPGPVPPVPPVPTQVRPGTGQGPGTGRNVTHDPLQGIPPAAAGTERPVPVRQPVPSLTRENELGTDGTGHPTLRVIGGGR